ncbi:MAG: universal stress protein [Candidatus Zixiibacteriota bacterium]
MTENKAIYSHILVPLENSSSDEAILKHIRPLALLTKAKLTIIHVADGFMARNQKRLGESEEMRQDWAYLQKIEEQFRAEGYEVRAILACGDPADNIMEVVERDGVDLIAMSVHGHRFLQDLILGSVSSAIKHRARVPVLLVRAQ